MSTDDTAGLTDIGHRRCSVEYAENGTGAVITYVASGLDADRATMDV